MFSTLVFCLILGFLATISAKTSITVHSDSKSELNIKIDGTGLGGCDVLLSTGETNTNDCWCLWGTLNYSFCAYKKSVGDEISVGNLTVAAKDASGRCPIITGESLVCSDIQSLGNCYGKGYSCTVDSNNLCHCSSV